MLYVHCSKKLCKCEKLLADCIICTHKTVTDNP